MSSIFYKSGIYNNRFYNSRIYNSGLYKNGGYNGQFVFLNNFDEIENNISKSDIGDDIFLDPNIFRSVSSNIFTGKNCIQYYSYSNSIVGMYVIDINFPETHTIESYISNYYGRYGNTNDCTQFIVRQTGIECIPSFGDYRLQIAVDNNDIELYNGATLFVQSGSYYYIKIPISAINNAHYACVRNNGYNYIFVNGVLYVKSKDIETISNKLQFERETYPAYTGINFISIRKGDFSNNLTSFTVPTSKYVFDG